MKLVAALALTIGALADVAVAGGLTDPFTAMAIQRPTEVAPAPDLRFVSLDGREVRLRALRGKPVLVGFFTTW